ncbi:MAG: sugar ABC transporter substrate-binding protein, partial [Oscillospiraceae bacterium]|nr:sugar ABC transporter substrate-binding protein [Oscillospiraceae bacterium]
VVVAVDGSAIVSSIKEAQAAGIPIVMNNRPMQGDEATAEYAILSDNEMMTYNQGTWLAEHARETGQQFNLCLIVGNLADENIVQRANGMRKAVEENPDVLSIVVEVPTKTNDEVLAGVQNAMQAYPAIDTIVIPADGQIPSVQSALEQINRWKKVGDPDHITFLTFDGHWFAMQGIDTGFVDCTAIQDCYGAGYKSAEWAFNLATGVKPSKLVDLDPGYLAYTANFAEVRESVWGWPLYLKNKDA